MVYILVYEGKFFFIKLKDVDKVVVIDVLLLD